MWYSEKNGFLHEEACTRSNFSTVSWTTTLQCRKSVCLCKHHHLPVETKLRCEHQAWIHRGWQLSQSKGTVWASAHEEQYTYPCTIGQSCPLLGGFSLSNRASFLCLWQMFQQSDSSMYCIKSREKAPCLLHFSSPHRQLALFFAHD